MTDSPPSEKQRAAYAGGKAAYAGGFESTVCPYPIVDPGQDPEQLGVLWVRGYVQARQAAGEAAPMLPQAPPPPVPVPTAGEG